MQLFSLRAMHFLLYPKITIFDNLLRVFLAGAHPPRVYLAVMRFLPAFQTHSRQSASLPQLATPRPLRRYWLANTRRFCTPKRYS